MSSVRERNFERLTVDEIATITPANGWREVWRRPDRTMAAYVNADAHAIAFFETGPHAQPPSILSSVGLDIPSLRANLLSGGITMESVLVEGPEIKAAIATLAQPAPPPEPTPAITPLPCGCFFSGREFITDPECEEHNEEDDT